MIWLWVNHHITTHTLTYTVHVRGIIDKILDYLHHKLYYVPDPNHSIVHACFINPDFYWIRLHNTWILYIEITCIRTRWNLDWFLFWKKKLPGVICLYYISWWSQSQYFCSHIPYILVYCIVEELGFLLSRENFFLLRGNWYKITTWKSLEIHTYV